MDSAGEGCGAWKEGEGVSEKLAYEFGARTIAEFINLQEKGQLNLEPAFQRDSVWNRSDRRKLIMSVLDGYPIPSVFLYRREEEGWPVYDVLDGKQRLETVFMFTRAPGFKQRHFDWDRGESTVKYEFTGDSGWDWWDWRSLQKEGRTAAFLSYKIPIVEVRGELSDITDLFVRINSTGKPLTHSEKLHAKYYKSPFMKEAQRLANRLRGFFEEEQIVTAGQFERMKDVELVSELLVSLAQGGLIHKKLAVDKAIGGQAINSHTLNRISGELTRVIGLIKKIFPSLQGTRFNHLSEFYSLFMLVREWDQQKLVLSDKKRNGIARLLLQQFSDGVDSVRELQKKTKGAGPDQQMFASYLLSTQQGTDNLGQRQHRAEILRGVFAGLFEKKDEQRIFSPEQRRLLWNSEAVKECRLCGCELSWGNFHVDHWKPYSKGGSTSLKNAKLLCVGCNTSKGSRKVRAA